MWKFIMSVHLSAQWISHILQLEELEEKRISDDKEPLINIL